MNDFVVVGSEKFSSHDLELLTGGEKTDSPKKFILLLARALRDPLKLPAMLKDFCSLCLEEEELSELRLALIRVQVDADLRMHEDIQRYQQRRYVAQVVEILVFKELLLSRREQLEEEEEY